MRSDRWRCGAVRAMVVGLVLTCLGGELRAQHADSTAHAMTHDMSWGRTTFVLTEVLELAPDAAGRPLAFDVIGWTGGASRRVWFKLDGASATLGQGTHAEAQVLYGAMISPWWDLQVGVRGDLVAEGGSAERRLGAVVALQGLAPGWFEVEPSLFVSAGGHVSFDFTASYDAYITQRLVLQPRVETSVALRDDVAFGIGRGVGPSSLALRTRYELRREFAPYLGVVWERRVGRTAELAGGSRGETLLVAGLRVWW